MATQLEDRVQVTRRIHHVVPNQLEFVGFAQAELLRTQSGFQGGIH